jgi:hypothetical protein
VVGDDDVLVETVRHEAVAPHRQRLFPVALLRADEPGGEVVDDAARQRLELLSVDGQQPFREVAHVLVEEALRAVGVDVAVAVGEDERRAVDDDHAVLHA